MYVMVNVTITIAVSCCSHLFTVVETFYSKTYQYGRSRDMKISEVDVMVLKKVQYL